MTRAEPPVGDGGPDLQTRCAPCDDQRICRRLSGLADLVLHEAQPQLVQQILGFSKAKAEVGRVGR